MSINEIAETIAREFPGEATIEHVDNPRVELYDHYYNVIHTALEGLGLKPTLLSTTLIDHLFDVVERHRDRVDAAGRDADRALGAIRRASSPPRPARSPRRELGGRGGPERAPGPGHGRFWVHRAPRRVRAVGRRRAGPRRRPAAPPGPVGRRRPGRHRRPRGAGCRVEGGFDSVVHLAAVTSVLRSLEQPELTYRTNVARDHRRCSRRLAPPA